MLTILFFALYAAAAAMLVKGKAQLKAFLGRYNALDLSSLEDYKMVARWNMYAALFNLAALVGGGALGLYLIFIGGSRMLLPVLAANAVVLITGKHVKRFEVRVRSLPVNDAQLALEYARINDTWIRKPLPDF
jgi:hypothetical protein